LGIIEAALEKGGESFGRAIGLGDSALVSDWSHPEVISLLSRSLFGPPFGCFSKSWNLGRHPF
jgi:hypothetical protein